MRRRPCEGCRAWGVIACASRHRGAWTGQRPSGDVSPASAHQAVSTATYKLHPTWLPAAFPKEDPRPDSLCFSKEGLPRRISRGLGENPGASFQGSPRPVAPEAWPCKGHDRGHTPSDSQVTSYPVCSVPLPSLQLSVGSKQY